MADSNTLDLILTPDQYSFVLDSTKGAVNCWHGPIKTSLSNTDTPVVFSDKTKKFEPRTIEQSKQSVLVAPENWYVVLKNPEMENKHPSPKTNNDTYKLDIGRKVNIIGPTHFALWPMQMAKVIRGHVLRSNQYLLVRVYDADEATKNWHTGVAKGLTDEDINLDSPVKLVNGQVLVIKGTEVSFYIPPTGLEVLKVDGKEGVYVREAVTLERLEYCVLKDEDGSRRFVQGPDVVFPEPTETFVTNDDGTPKYKAYELNEISGIYVKVVADYEEDGVEHKIGEELFLTGKDIPIYIPRPEHAIISYGDQAINHAIAIPEGEGRYVLNRLKGSVDTVVGPTMLLPDPRKQVIVKRVLSQSQAELWFPGNRKVADYNNNLRASLANESATYLAASALSQMDFDNTIETLAFNTAKGITRGGGETSIARKSTFTKPRMITLQSDEYEGVVSIDVWTGYAIKVVDKVGNSKVIVGPTTYLVGYNESLEVMELSTSSAEGTKTTDRLLKTVFLRVKNNKIKDVIPVETKDFCTVNVKVSYNVDFVGDTDSDRLKWFDSDNYVKLLCDRMKSKIRRQVKKLSLEEFYGSASEIISEVVLGEKYEGTLFRENNMNVFDVEVITVHIEDRNINELFARAQYETIQKQLELTQSETQSDIAGKLAEFERTNIQTKFDVESEKLRIQTELEEAKATLKQTVLEKEQTLEQMRLEKEKALATEENAIAQLKLEIEKARNDQKFIENERNNNLEKDMIAAESQAFTEKMTSISPNLISAMNSLAEAGLLTRVAESIAPYALASNNENVSDIIKKLTLNETTIEDVIAAIKNK